MLPLVQRHPMVHPTRNLHDSPHLPVQQYPLPYFADERWYRQPKDPQPLFPGGYPQQQVLPIRTSRDAYQAQLRQLQGGLPLDTNIQEHHLRRKTPNGTLDAGYDGSHAQMAQGPPPLKHVILSTDPINDGAPNPRLDLESIGHSSASSFQSRLQQQHQNWPGQQRSQDGYTHPQALRSHFFGSGSHDLHGVYSSASPAFGGNLACMWPLPDSQASHLAHSTYMPLASTQPAQRLTPFGSKGGYGDATRVNEPVHHIPNHSYRHLATQTGPCYPISASPATGTAPIFSIWDPYLHSDAATGGPWLSRPKLDPSAADPSLTLPTMQEAPVQFRQKVGAQAQRAYLDLLAYLHYTRKSQQSTLGLTSGSKVLIYPKPPSIPEGRPKPPKLFAWAASESSIDPQTYAGGFVSPDAAKQPHVGSSVANPWPAFGRQTQQIHSPALMHTGPPLIPESQSAQGFKHYTAKSSPIPAAKASLEMLTHLCEQSNWEWADGIMLGGCLNFGLDRYEEALQWFSRITDIHANHVDAITNIAATLYCLGRREEAEKYWFRAVKKRPQALESAEHLVGLLYKKRSREAVQVIDFVQQSLRLGESTSSKPGGGNSTAFTSHDRGQAGWGSSGYAVPGSENGRILALVHAKGTMLYSLKDVEKASRSFEEAVLISTGRRVESMRDLVSRIQTVLSHGGNATPSDGTRPLLLPPETARHTARLVFAGERDLPGLRNVMDGGPKRAAVQTTSNSLLSLAKIYQDAMSSGSPSPGLLRWPMGIDGILALYYLSLSLQESPSTANNVGILLASVQQPAAPSTRLQQSGGKHLSNIPGIVPGSGLALALSYYHYGLALDPKHVHLHTNLGSLLKDIGQLDLAISMYERAVSCDGNFDIALTNLANAVKDRGRIKDAIGYYRRAVNANPDFAEAVCGLSTALNSVCDWEGRGGMYLDGGRFDRWHVDKDGILVDAQARKEDSGLMMKVASIVQKQLEDAAGWGVGLLSAGTATELTAYMQEVGLITASQADEMADNIQSWSRQRWEGSRLLRLLERCTRALMRRWYLANIGHSPVPASASWYARPRLPASLTIPPAPTVLPFHTFTCPLTARNVRQISQRNALRISCSTLRSPWLPGTVYKPPKPPSPQLKVGYVSSDFNNHPLAHLMQSVFGLHDTAKVEAICYATTASDKSVHRLQIEREAPVFRDVSSWSAHRVVNQIVEDGIHILVNLNGYTRGARNEIFAARPAPIQMSFMGFAGTLGAEWCDYILADSTAIPSGTLRPWRGNLEVTDIFQDESESSTGDWVYSENIIFCRDTFFCCDHAQSSDASERHVTWGQEQRRRWKMRRELFPMLSDDTVIMGNFNQLYKIDPSTFRTWLRILSRVRNAVLWLLRFPELGETNLRQTAKAWAGEEVASRIIFTDVAPKDQHIARARVCDLFLDTPECNAHTTAADVLWSSTPLLTLPRYPYKMCSRMAASILKGALPRGAEGQRAAGELVAEDEDDYEKKAVALASGLYYQSGREFPTGCGRLAELRKLLWNSKWSCSLFDTHRWVADLEQAYQEAWRKWVAGESGDIYL